MPRGLGRVRDAVERAIGSLFQRTAAATAAAYTVLLSICAFAVDDLDGPRRAFGHSTVEGALTVNPVAAALSVISRAGDSRTILIPANWWFLGVFSVCPC